MSLTEVKIFGVSTVIDPLSVDVQVEPLSSIRPALTGAMFVNYLNSNPAALGAIVRVTIRSSYLSTTDVVSLITMAANREVSTIVGIPGAPAGKYNIQSLSAGPQPAVLFPGETTVVVRHEYSLTLIRVTNF